MIKPLSRSSLVLSLVAVAVISGPALFRPLAAAIGGAPAWLMVAATGAAPLSGGAPSGAVPGFGQPAGVTSADALALAPGDNPMWWAAEGTCSPRPVTPSLIRMLFDPNVLGPAPAGLPPLPASDDAGGVTIGDYRISLDVAGRRVTVAGPAGAELLQRELERCVAPGSATTRPTSAGRWQWSSSENAWRYVESQLPATRPDIGAPQNSG